MIKIQQMAEMGPLEKSQTQQYKVD